MTPAAMTDPTVEAILLAALHSPELVEDVQDALAHRVAPTRDRRSASGMTVGEEVAA